MGAIDLELDRADVWEDDEVNTALGYMEDLKQYIMLNFGETAQGGNVDDYVRLTYTVSNNIGGGTATGGSWLTRPINTEFSDSGSICSLSGNDFALASGTYKFLIVASFGNVNAMRIRLYNVSDAAIVLISPPANISANGINGLSMLSGQFTIAATKTMRMQYRTSFTQPNGLGLASNFGDDETYTTIDLWRTSS
ncbi:hypothetical protein [Thiocapsa sp. N5-Cardenillas]|uniref:hypothetical protein n=1 Tax=Thiocapsa sp. N5-Cardenillas TaxID=3137397 RepID=UPI0035B0D5E1